MKLDKVYIVTDNCVWDDDDYSRIVCIATTKELAQEKFKEYVEQVKEDLDIDNLDISEDGIDDGYVIEEDSDYFRVFLNGEYNSFHTYISLYEQELITEKERLDNYEL